MCNAVSSLNEEITFISALHVGARWRSRVAAYLAELEGDDLLLDAGCGEGFATVRFSEEVAFSLGVDLVAEKSCPKIGAGQHKFSLQTMADDGPAALIAGKLRKHTVPAGKRF